MSKHTHHQSREEQIYNKAHGAVPFHHEEKPHRENGPTKLEYDQRGVVSERHIQLRAYQVHEERGGSELDNWLEAEQIMMNPTNLLATSDRTGSGGVS